MTTKKSGPAWWRALGWRSARRRPGQGGIDFADMGTVFGLEASLAESGDNRPAEPHAASGDAAEARQRSAIERLNGRSVR